MADGEEEVAIADDHTLVRNLRMLYISNFTNNSAVFPLGSCLPKEMRNDSCILHSGPNLRYI